MRISMCHCLACQRRTGSGHAVQARFPREQVTAIEGTSTAYERTGDSGGRITFHFCPTCGATVHYALDGLPGFVVVPVGAFADPTFPGPKVSVYEARRHPWSPVPETVIEHLD